MAIERRVINDVLSWWDEKTHTWYPYSAKELTDLYFSEVVVQDTRQCNSRTHPPITYYENGTYIVHDMGQ